MIRYLIKILGPREIIADGSAELRRLTHPAELDRWPPVAKGTASIGGEGCCGTIKIHVRVRGRML